MHGGMLIFDGSGYGHGVGLCQAGAEEMASEHKSTADILGFYFPGTSVRIGPDDNGWQVTHTPSLTVHSIQIESPVETGKLETTWRQANQRFPSHKTLHPEITFAPSTELFRQMTSQPGWALASTQRHADCAAAGYCPESDWKRHQQSRAARDVACPGRFRSH